MNSFWEERFRELDALIGRLGDDASAWEAARDLADDSVHRLHTLNDSREEGWVAAAEEYFAQAVAFADQRNAGEFADAIAMARAAIP